MSKWFSLLYIFFLANVVLSQKKAVSYTDNMLWEISSQHKKPSYIFGTIHLNNFELFNLSDSVYYAFNHTDVYSPEVDIRDLYHLYQNRLNDNLLIDSDGRIYKNTHAAMRTSYGNPKGWPQFMDAYFYQIAVNSSKKVSPLETLIDQMTSINSIIYTDYHYNDYLSTEKMVDAYLSGDEDKLRQIIYEQFKGSNGYNELITKRNIKMTAKIDSIIQHLGSTFVAIGAGHLAGDYGVIHLLQKKGYHLRPIKSIWTSQSNDDKQVFKKYKSYLYKDSVLNFSVYFDMRPLRTQEGDNFSLMSRDLGQGNIYLLEVEKIHHANYIIDDYLEENFYLPINSSINHIKTLQGDDAREAIVDIDEYGLSRKRIFIRDGYLYKLTCSGSIFFLNSNRPNSFFDSLHFGQ